jgi:hypothetical protein
MGQINKIEKELNKMFFGHKIQSTLYIALYTKSPRKNKYLNATRREATYTNYRRVSVARNAEGWDIRTLGDGLFTSVSNATAVYFPECGEIDHVEKITHFAILDTPEGPGSIFFWGPFDSALCITKGVIPSFARGAIMIVEG